MADKGVKIGHFTEPVARQVLRRLSIAQAPSFGLADESGIKTRPPIQQDVWLGIITDQGPAAEADYTDERYWVQSAAITNASGSNPPNTTLPTFAALTTGTEAAKWITATNIAEVGSGAHGLSVGDIVYVEEGYGLDQSPYYLFSSTPPSSSASYAQMTAASLSVTVTTAGTFYQVTGMTAGVSSGITIDGSSKKFTIVTAGKYLISCSMSMGTNHTAFTTILEFQLFKNGSAIAELLSTSPIIKNGQGQTFSMVGIVDAAVNDYYELFLSCNVNGAVVGVGPVSFVIHGV